MTLHKDTSPNFGTMVEYTKFHIDRQLIKGNLVSHVELLNVRTLDKQPEVVESDLPGGYSGNFRKTPICSKLTRNVPSLEIIDPPFTNILSASPFSHITCCSGSWNK